MVYLYFDGKISALGGMGSAKQYHVNGYDEDIFVAGSGSERFIELLSGYQGEMEFSQHRAISILSRLWTLDLTTQVNLKERFGGAYELGVQIGRGVAKIGDILFANAFGNSDFEFGTDGRILKIDYIGSYLCLRVISHDYSRVEKTEQNIVTLRQDGITKRIYMIRPIDGAVFRNEDYAEELATLMSDMNAEWTCVHLIAETKNGQYLSNQRAFHRPARNSPVEVNPQGEVHWTKELCNNLLEDLKSFYEEQGELPET